MNFEGMTKDEVAWAFAATKVRGSAQKGVVDEVHGYLQDAFDGDRVMCPSHAKVATMVHDYVTGDPTTDLDRSPLGAFLYLLSQRPGYADAYGDLTTAIRFVRTLHFTLGAYTTADPKADGFHDTLRVTKDTFMGHLARVRGRVERLHRNRCFPDPDLL